MGLSRNAAYMYPTKNVLVGKTYENQQKSFKINQESFGTSFVYFVSNKAVKRVQISAMAKSGFQWINRLPWGKGSPMFPQLANGCNPSWDIMGIYPMSTWPCLHGISKTLDHQMRNKSSCTQLWHLGIIHASSGGSCRLINKRLWHLSQCHHFLAKVIFHSAGRTNHLLNR